MYAVHGNVPFKVHFREEISEGNINSPGKFQNGL